MAKNTDIDENDEHKGGGLLGAIIAIVIIIIWLLVFALLVKMDVGGFGTNVMRPLFKDVPVISAILPNVSDEEVAEETGYKYKTLYEAMERIKELENEVTSYQENANTNAEKIAELTSEVERLRVFEENQLAFEEQKKKFDEEVVFTDNAPNIEAYKSWYELMYPENAADIYARVAERVQTSAKIKGWATTFSKMDAAAAAKILQEMTGDLDLVAEILSSMNATTRANVLAAMDSVYAAKLTNIMHPN